MKRILVVNPFGIGDVLFTSPVIWALKKKYPDSFIAYLCNSQAAPLLQHNPAINELLFYSRGDFKKIKKQSYARYVGALGKAFTHLRSLKFDIAVDLSLTGHYVFAMWLAGIRQRWGFDYKKRGWLLTNKIILNGFKDKHVVDYYRDLLSQIGVNIFQKRLELYLGQDDIAWADNFLKPYSQSNAELLIGIAPFGGSSWGQDAAKKELPQDKYAEVLNKIIKPNKGRIILFGTEVDKEKTANLLSSISAERVINAVGKTTLGRLAALIKKCNLFIGNDSGPAHIACALGIKTIAIFGPVDESVYGPVGNNDGFKVICADISCRPCYKNFKKPECGKMDCLVNIKEGDILNAIERML